MLFFFHGLLHGGYDGPDLPGRVFSSHGSTVDCAVAIGYDRSSEDIISHRLRGQVSRGKKLPHIFALFVCWTRPIGRPAIDNVPPLW